MNRNTAVTIIAKGNDMTLSHSPQPILSTDDLGIIYPGGIEALRATSINFQRGEFTVLLGLSGAGKSSLLRSLNHLVKPT